MYSNNSDSSDSILITKRFPKPGLVWKNKNSQHKNSKVIENTLTVLWSKITKCLNDIVNIDKVLKTKMVK